jgi:hypothetical protein
VHSLGKKHGYLERRELGLMAEETEAYEVWESEKYVENTFNVNTKYMSVSRLPREATASVNACHVELWCLSQIVT